MNASKCAKCGEIVHSKFRHDFRQCSCGAIFVDGGNDYHRIGGKPEDHIPLTSEEIDGLNKEQD